MYKIAGIRKDNGELDVSQEFVSNYPEVLEIFITKLRSDVYSEFVIVLEK